MAALSDAVTSAANAGASLHCTMQAAGVIAVPSVMHPSQSSDGNISPIATMGIMAAIAEVRRPCVMRPNASAIESTSGMRRRSFSEAMQIHYQIIPTAPMRNEPGGSAARGYP